MTGTIRWRVDESMWYSPSLQQLLFLEAVLEEGNFVRAADRLHTTHSTISRSLKALSEGLGINLFDKTPRGLKPNITGQIYATQIRTSLEHVKLAFDLARYEAGLHRRPFHVGHSPYIHGSLLPLHEQLTLPGSEAPSNPAQKRDDDAVGVARAAWRASSRLWRTADC